jgi:flagellar hook-associated protein 3 FlgL
MSIDRVSTSAQTAFFLSQIQNAGNALDTVQEQIASGKNANTYAGFGDKAQILTATIAAKARNTAYTNATKFAVTQTDLQDTQLTSLSSLATSLKKAVSDAVANNDATTLMTQAQSIFEQASAILNSKDANGDYIYSGGKTDVPPVTVGSLTALQALPGVSGAFANGNLNKSVQVADGVTVD